MAIVYLCQNLIDGKCYVGVTSRKTLGRRRYEHEWHAANGSTKCPKFYAALRFHGVSAFNWLVISTWDTFAEALKAEVQAITELRPAYNLTAGGEGTVGVVRSAEYCAKQRAAHIGKKQSAETIEKRVGRWRGTKRAPDVVERAAAPNRGRKVSAELRAKLSAAHVGKGHSDETRAKMSATRKGVARPRWIIEAMRVGRLAQAQRWREKHGRRCVQ